MSLQECSRHVFRPSQGSRQANQDAPSRPTDSALAKRRLADIARRKRTGWPTKGTMTFDQLAERWLAFMKSDLRPASWKRLTSIVRVVKPFFTGLPVRSIGQRQIEAWKIKRGAAVSARSFNYEREVLRRLFEYARGIPCASSWTIPQIDIKKRKVGSQRMVIPRRNNFGRWWKPCAQEPRVKMRGGFRRIPRLLRLRLGEATQVRWRDVNFEAEFAARDRRRAGHEESRSANDSAFPAAASMLEWRMDDSHAREQIFSAGLSKTALDTACEKAGLPHFGHHAMRHFFCSNAIEAGCDFKVIAGWLGHKDGGVLVAQTYGHLRNEHSAAMAKRLTFDLAV